MEFNMKYFFASCFIILLSATVYSEINYLEQAKPRFTTYSTVCIDGYKFAVAKDESGISMVQYFQTTSIPTRC